MTIEVRKYTENDIDVMAEIWNEVVEDGVAFPQLDLLNHETAEEFWKSNTYCGVAYDTIKGTVVGMYILHPNNIGRCGHIANASYCVKREYKGMPEHIGEKLVLDSLKMAKEFGFKVMQFNAVVKSNIHARHLYERVGFVPLGFIPKGFKMKDGHYEDICPYYIEL